MSSVKITTEDPMIAAFKASKSFTKAANNRPFELATGKRGWTTSDGGLTLLEGDLLHLGGRDEIGTAEIRPGQNWSFILGIVERNGERIGVFQLPLSYYRKTAFKIEEGKVTDRIRTGGNWADHRATSSSCESFWASLYGRTLEVVGVTVFKTPVFNPDLKLHLGDEYTGECQEGRIYHFDRTDYEDTLSEGIDEELDAPTE